MKKKTMYLVYEDIKMEFDIDLVWEHCEIWGVGDKIVVERKINEQKPPYVIQNKSNPSPLTLKDTLE